MVHSPPPRVQLQMNKRQVMILNRNTKTQKEKKRVVFRPVIDLHDKKKLSYDSHRTNQIKL